MLSMHKRIQEEAKQLLAKVLPNVEKPQWRPGQEDSIVSVTLGNHTLAIMATGQGKTETAIIACEMRARRIRANSPSNLKTISLIISPTSL